MQCPVCRAANDRGPQCRRCRADLSLLFDLEVQRGQLLGVTRESLACGQTQEARATALRADGMRSDDESRRLLAVCHLLEKNFAAAWRVYQSIAPRRG